MMLVRALGRRQAGLVLQGLGRASSTSEPLVAFSPLGNSGPLVAFSSLGNSGPLVAFSLHGTGGPLVSPSVRSCHTDQVEHGMPQGERASRTLELESKRFYLDVKKNKRGRFIQVAELNDGKRNQILMTISTAALFSQHLVTFIEYYQQLAKVDPENLNEGELKSEVMIKNDEKYHMDLKENAHGRFLQVSETFTTGDSRFQVLIPAEGMAEFQQNLEELIDGRPPALAAASSGGWAGERKSGDKIVVRGLAETFTWADLKDHFSRAGDIKFADMMESGVGLVKFETKQDAERAVEKMNGQTIDGRQVQVALYL